MKEPQKSSASERQARLQVCQACERFQDCESASKLALAETVCPLALWPQRIEGAGDLVAAVAQPVARTIDAIFGSDFANCTGCKERQDWLNRKLPFQPPD